MTNGFDGPFRFAFTSFSIGFSFSWAETGATRHMAASNRGAIRISMKTPFDSGRMAVVPYYKEGKLDGCSRAKRLAVVRSRLCGLRCDDGDPWQDRRL